MIDDMKIVDFNEYCGKCKHADTDPWEDPCDECLCAPARPNSRRPLNFVAEEEVTGKECQC